MFEADTDLQWCYHCLPLNAGLLIAALGVLIFGGFALIFTLITAKRDFMFILACIVLSIILLGGIYVLSCAFFKDPRSADHSRVILIVVELALILTLVAQWIQWAILLAKTPHFAASFYTMMAAYTVLCIIAILVADYGRSIAASLNCRREEGLTGWEKRKPEKEYQETKPAVQPQAKAAAPTEQEAEEVQEAEEEEEEEEAESEPSE